MSKYLKRVVPSIHASAAGQDDKVGLDSDAKPGANTVRVAAVARDLQTAPNVHLGVLYGMVESASIPDFSEPMPEDELRRWGG